MTNSLISILFMLLPAVVAAQNFTYRLMTQVEMAPSEEMTRLYFDHNGMMWIGTVSGLKSYDGYNFRTYRSDAFTPGIFPNNSIMSITEDRNGYLWVGTRNGIVRMDRRMGKYKTYRLGSGPQQIVYTLYTTRDGIVWAGTDKGLNRYDSKKDKFYLYETANSTMIEPDGKKRRLPSAYSVKSIAENAAGTLLYIGTWDHGLLRMKRSGNVFHRYSDINGDPCAFSLYMDPMQRLWIGTWNKSMMCMQNPSDFSNPQTINYFNGGNMFRNYYSIVGDTVTNTLWGCSREGVSIIHLNNIKAGFTNRFTVDNKDLMSCGFNNYMAMDPTGNIWLQSNYRRIRQIVNRPTPFERLFHEVSDIPLNVSSIRCIYTDDGNAFYLGLLPFGLALYNRSTGTAVYNNNIPCMRNVPPQVVGAAFSSIIRRRNGELWFASNSYGVVIVKQGKPTRILNRQNSRFILDQYVNTLMEQSDGTMWIGSRQGLSVITPNGVGKLMNMTDKRHNYTSCDVRKIIETKDGTVWVSTENEGIIRIRHNQRKSRGGGTFSNL